MKRKDEECAKRSKEPAVFIRAAGLGSRRKSGEGVFPEMRRVKLD